MSLTQGVMYNEAQNLLAAIAASQPVTMYFHLFILPATVSITDVPEGLYTELVNSGYAKQRITSAQLHFTPTPPPAHYAVQGFVFNLGPPPSGFETILGWWIDIEGPPAALSLFGGLFSTPIVIPPAGFTLSIAKIDLFVHDCGTLPPPPLPGVRWLDPFIDTYGTPLLSHQPIIGSNYTAGQGVFDVGDALVFTTSNNSQDSITFDPGVSDGTITCTLDCRSGGVGGIGRPYLLFRVQDSANMFGLLWAPDANLIAIQKVVAGSFSTVSSSTTVPGTPQSAALEIVLSADSITYTLNDGSGIVYVDSFGQHATKMGLLLGHVPPGLTPTWRNLLVRG